MRWNLRMKAAEQGIWKSAELRRRHGRFDHMCRVQEGKVTELAD